MQNPIVIAVLHGNVGVRRTPGGGLYVCKTRHRNDVSKPGHLAIGAICVDSGTSDNDAQISKADKQDFLCPWNSVLVMAYT
jgi:hypothetical protein